MLTRTTTTTSLDPKQLRPCKQPRSLWGLCGVGEKRWVRRRRRGAYMLLAVALQEQEVRGLVEGVPHAAAAAAAPRRRRAAGQGGAVPLEPGPAAGPAAGPGPAPCPPYRGPQAGLAEAAPQGRGGPAPLSPRRPPGPPRPVPLQLPRLGVDACGDGEGDRAVFSPCSPPRAPQHPAAGGMLRLGAGMEQLEPSRRCAPTPACMSLLLCPPRKVTPARRVECPNATAKKGVSQPCPGPQTSLNGEQRVHSIPHLPWPHCRDGEEEIPAKKELRSIFANKKEKKKSPDSAFSPSALGRQQQGGNAGTPPPPIPRHGSCSGARLQQEQAVINFSRASIRAELSVRETNRRRSE